MQSRTGRSNFCALQACGACMPTPFPILDVETYRIGVDFDLVDDPNRRRRLKNIATTWTLETVEVDELRAVACELLRESLGYQQLLDDMASHLSGTCAVTAR